MWLFRNRSNEEYKSYLRMFEPPEEESNIPKLQIFLCDPDAASHEGHADCCPIMVDAIKACNYANKKADGKAVEDIAEFEGDDPIDDLRYAVDSAEAYVTEAGEEFKKVQKQAALVEQLRNSQDWTAFYRNARTIEAGSHQQMVRRFHGHRR
jgi:hypothetical protein